MVLYFFHIVFCRGTAKAEISNDQFDELVSQGNYSAVFNGNVSSYFMRFYNNIN